MTPLTTARTKDIKPQDDIRLTRSHSTVFFWGKNTTGMLGGFALLSRLLSRWQCLKRHWGWSEKACNLEEMASKTSKDIFLLLIFLRAMTVCTAQAAQVVGIERQKRDHLYFKLYKKMIRENLLNGWSLSSWCISFLPLAIQMADAISNVPMIFNEFGISWKNE